MDKGDNVLFYNEERIIDDARFAVTFDNSRTQWSMRIFGVSPKDNGRYRCVANTKPIKLKYYQLTVFGKLSTECL